MQRKIIPKKVDVLLTPTVPPLYPTAPKPLPLKRSSLDNVAVYKRFCRYYTSNYSVEVILPTRSAFQVERYTDKYKATLTLNSEIVHKVHDVRFPDELTSKAPLKKSRKTRSTKKKNLDDLEDEEDKTEQEGGSKKAGEEETEAAAVAAAEIIEEEELDDGDEELDMGTDYASSYFDNGEGFLDSDHDGDEDGPVY